MERVRLADVIADLMSWLTELAEDESLPEDVRASAEVYEELIEEAWST